MPSKVMWIVEGKRFILAAAFSPTQLPFAPPNPRVGADLNTPPLHAKFEAKTPYAKLLLVQIFLIVTNKSTSRFKFFFIFIFISNKI